MHHFFKAWRVGFSPREALASLGDGGAKAPRGLKPALQSVFKGRSKRQATMRAPCLAEMRASRPLQKELTTPRACPDSAG